MPSKKEQVVVGIDLGHEHAYVSVWRDDAARSWKIPGSWFVRGSVTQTSPGPAEQRLADFQERSVVAFTEFGCLVGNAADGCSQAVSVVVEIGKSLDATRNTYPVQGNIRKTTSLSYQEGRWTAEHLLAVLLVHLKERAEALAEVPITSVHLGLPGYFNPMQAARVITAAAYAGLEVKGCQPSLLYALLPLALERREEELVVLICRARDDHFEACSAKLDHGIVEALAFKASALGAGEDCIGSVLRKVAGSERVHIVLASEAAPGDPQLEAPAILEHLATRHAARGVLASSASARGAAICARQLSMPSSPDAIYLRTLSTCSLGLDLQEGEGVEVLILRGTALPATETLRVPVRLAGETELAISYLVYAGESDDAATHMMLGTVMLAGLPARNGGELSIDVTLEQDSQSLGCKVCLSCPEAGLSHTVRLPELQTITTTLPPRSWPFQCSAKVLWREDFRREIEIRCLNKEQQAFDMAFWRAEAAPSSIQTMPVVALENVIQAGGLSVPPGLELNELQALATEAFYRRQAFEERHGSAVSVEARELAAEQARRQATRQEAAVQELRAAMVAANSSQTFNATGFCNAINESLTLLYFKWYLAGPMRDELALAVKELDYRWFDTQRRESEEQQAKQQAERQAEQDRRLAQREAEVAARARDIEQKQQEVDMQLQTAMDEHEQSAMHAVAAGEHAEAKCAAERLKAAITELQSRASDQLLKQARKKANVLLAASQKVAADARRAAEREQKEAEKREAGRRDAERKGERKVQREQAELERQEQRRQQAAEKKAMADQAKEEEEAANAKQSAEQAAREVKEAMEQAEKEQAAAAKAAKEENAAEVAKEQAENAAAAAAMTASKQKATSPRHLSPTPSPAAASPPGLAVDSAPKAAVSDQGFLESTFIAESRRVPQRPDEAARLAELTVEAEERAGSAQARTATAVREAHAMQQALDLESRRARELESARDLLREEWLSCREALTELQEENQLLADQQAQLVIESSAAHAEQLQAQEQTRQVERQLAQAREQAATVSEQLGRARGELASLQQMDAAALGRLETEAKAALRRIEERHASVREEESLCPICYDRRKDTVLVPCGHQLCHECQPSLPMRSMVQHCPVCQTPVDQHVRLYS